MHKFHPHKNQPHTPSHSRVPTKLEFASRPTARGQNSAWGESYVYGTEQIRLPVIRGAPCSLVLLVKETKEGQARPTVFTTVGQEWMAEIKFMCGGFCG